MKIGWPSGLVPLLGTLAPEHATRWGAAAAPPAPWSRVLLMVDPEGEGLPLPALRVAWRLVGDGGALHVLAPVVLPLAIPLEAPPGDETERAAALLEEVERWAGAHGVRVEGHLRRGRTRRALLRDAVRDLGADAVVLGGDPDLLRRLAPEAAPAQPILVPS